MSEEDSSIGDNAAMAGIEYGGWGLLLLFFLKRLCTIARNNGIYLEFTSPCRVNCKFDSHPNGRRSENADADEEDDSNDLEMSELSDEADTSSDGVQTFDENESP